MTASWSAGDRTLPPDAAWPVGLPLPVRVRLLSGGWVARTWRAVLADGTFAAVKITPFPAGAEVDGLRALAGAGVPVPEILGHAGSTLVLRWTTGPADWRALGRAVAGMHGITGHVATADRYGWHRDNHAGRFVQPNAWLGDWPTFFVERRVRIHLTDPVLPAQVRLRLERACDGPIQDLLPAHPPASLTHGDLWSGNVVAGRWVVDPEVSYADRELDLAYMQMSRDAPLPDLFWAGYHDLLSLPAGYEERRTVLELHHRLLALRHFGTRFLPGLIGVLDERGW